MSSWIYMPPIDMEWETSSKIKSLENVGYSPSGGNKSIESHKLQWRSEAKVSSLDEKHMALVDRSQSSPRKDHVRRIKIPPNIPASNFKKVEYTRSGVYAIVEPVKIQGKSKIDFPKHDFGVQERKPSEKVDVSRRIKLTKNSRVDNYKHVEQTDAGTFAVVEPVGKIEAKSKVDFAKIEPVSERKPSEMVDVTRRIKLTKNTRLDKYKNLEQTDAGTYAIVDPVHRIQAKSKIDFSKPESDRKQSEKVDVSRRIKLTKNSRVDKYKHVEQTDAGTYAVVEPVGKIEAKSKVDFPKAEPVQERKPSENIDVTRRIKLTKNSRVDNYKHVEQTDAGTYAVVEPVGKIEAKSKVDFPKADPVQERKPSENIDVTRRIKLTKNSRVDKYKHVEQTNAGTYAVVEPVGKIEAKSKVDFPKADTSKDFKRKSTADNIEHRYKFF